MISEIERMVNKVIPNEIKEILFKKNELNVLVDDKIEKFIVFSLEEMLDNYKEQEDLFDYDIIPFASLDDDYLCLYYHNTNISIIYWSTERAFESKQMAIFELYPAYTDFINECITTKPPLGQA